MEPPPGDDASDGSEGSVEGMMDSFNEMVQARGGLETMMRTLGVTTEELEAGALPLPPPPAAPPAERTGGPTAAMEARKADAAALFKRGDHAEALDASSGRAGPPRRASRKRVGTGRRSGPATRRASIGATWNIST